MTDVTHDHEMTETIHIDVIVPGHAPRGAASALFHSSRLKLIDREGGRCWLSGMTEADAGLPLEAHHYPIERCFAEKIDWPRFAIDAQAGHFGPYAQAFDWAVFLATVPMDVYAFVDDMTVNGRLLAKQFHTGSDGIHELPEPIYLARKYMIEGYKFMPDDVVHHFSSVGNGNPPPPPPDQNKTKKK